MSSVEKLRLIKSYNFSSITILYMHILAIWYLKRLDRRNAFQLDSQMIYQFLPMMHKRNYHKNSYRDNCQIEITRYCNNLFKSEVKQSIASFHVGAVISVVGGQPFTFKRMHISHNFVIIRSITSYLTDLFQYQHGFYMVITVRYPRDIIFMRCLMFI